MTALPMEQKFMPIVGRITRGDYTESFHVIYAVVVDEMGEVIRTYGQPDYLTCVRSSLKPWQAAAAVAAGAVDAAGFTEAELALMCASHNGEAAHVKTAQSMIAKLGYSADNYECGCHPPYDQETRNKLIATATPVSPYYNNCSGKHAGMLALAKQLKADPAGYTATDHPVQQAILEMVQRYTGLKDIPFGIDGCSAPTPFLPLQTIASLFGKLADSTDPLMDRIYRAMTSNPFLIGGTGRFDTDFMTTLQGRAVTKVGGEAVRGIGLRRPDGSTIGIAMKVLDGNTRALNAAAICLLDELNLISKEDRAPFDGYQPVVLTNHRKIETGLIVIEIPENEIS